MKNRQRQRWQAAFSWSFSLKLMIGCKSVGLVCRRRTGRRAMWIFQKLIKMVMAFMLSLVEDGRRAQHSTATLAWRHFVWFFFLFSVASSSGLISDYYDNYFNWVSNWHFSWAVPSRPVKANYQRALFISSAHTQSGNIIRERLLRRLLCTAFLMPMQNHSRMLIKIKKINPNILTECARPAAFKTLTTDIHFNGHYKKNHNSPISGPNLLENWPNSCGLIFAERANGGIRKTLRKQCGDRMLSAGRRLYFLLYSYIFVQIPCKSI